MNNFADDVKTLDIDDLTAAWMRLELVSGLRPLRADADHLHALQLVEAIWSVVGEDAAHPLSSLFDLLVDMISEYEKTHFAIGQDRSEPHEMLAFMMEQGERTAADLAGIIDSSRLAAVLAGNQKIDATLARKLAEYFRVKPQLFLSLAK
ncbi:transcriptional regulator [Duganella sp. FT80W]|uniref:Transcriptional regulator n=1 Tax=Duganella guangzhouensis TaxID=2666084 RepID=A0A6I2L2W3_9BURK|nr:transcriptional regulator [Duganella guangzhouensis]MRW91567.1 transcriptional regulator [Duganella guangzhouensis]